MKKDKRNEGGSEEFPHGVPRPDRDKWLWKPGDVKTTKPAKQSQPGHPRGGRARS